VSYAGLYRRRRVACGSYMAPYVPPDASCDAVLTSSNGPIRGVASFDAFVLPYGASAAGSGRRRHGRRLAQGLTAASVPTYVAVVNVTSLGGVFAVPLPSPAAVAAGGAASAGPGGGGVATLLAPSQVPSSLAGNTVRAAVSLLNHNVDIKCYMMHYLPRCKPGGQDGASHKGCQRVQNVTLCGSAHLPTQR
jgi:hypothetical protein